MEKVCNKVDVSEFVIDSSQNINFVFVLRNMNDRIMSRFNGMIDVDRRAFLKTHITSVSFEKIDNIVFRENLILIDSRLPEMVAELLLYGNAYRISKFPDIVRVLKTFNPLRYQNSDVYEYKHKKFLSNVVIGKLPNENWYGNSFCGGCIVARIGEIMLVCDSRNEERFETFLFNHSLLCVEANKSMENFASIYKENKEYYMNLNLQIRFQA